MFIKKNSFLKEAVSPTPTQITENFSTTMCSEMAGVYISIPLSWFLTIYIQQHKVNCRVHSRVFSKNLKSSFNLS